MKEVKYNPFGSTENQYSYNSIPVSSGSSKSHLKSICNGSVPQDKVLEFYDKTIITPTALLTTAQIFKLHAILSQKKYELPTRVITNGNKSYLRAYEFYGREYEFDSNHKPFFKVFEAEAALGSKRFEYIENEDCEILMYDMTSFLKFKKKVGK